MLIHQATEAYLFKGTVRRIAGSDHMEIALYRGEEKSERRHERYALNLFALVQGVTRAGELLPELKRVSLRILDISAGGLRFACKDQLFQIGDRISMQLFIRGEFKFFYCEIVRYIGEPDGLHEYGCRLMTKAEYEVN